MNNVETLGIIFPNSYDSMVSDLAAERLMGSIPFASRYRLVDFVLSNMVNSGIDSVSLITKRNYHSLMDHLGSGREWDLTRKNGGLNIIPPYSEKSVQVYSGKVEALASVIPYLKRQKAKYVVLADAHAAMNFDYKDFVAKHIASGATVSVAYADIPIPEGLMKDDIASENLYYTLELDGDKVTGMKINNKKEGEQHFCMNIYCVEREHLINSISVGYAKGYRYLERDLIIPDLEKIDVRAYKYEGYLSYITSMKSYFDENMKLLDEDNVEKLFDPSPIYTKIRDDNPTRYISGSKAKNIMAADGCIIEGEVENSILFRGVHIGKGAKVSNCVLMQDTVIGDGAVINHIITDKNVVISEGTCMTGTDSFPVYVTKGQIV